jgi:ATP-dependent RNA helicase DDX24/MAK5
LSLDEIGEADYSLGIPEQENTGRKPNLEGGHDGDCAEAVKEEKVEGVAKEVKKEKKKKLKKNEEPANSTPVVEETEEIIQEDSFDESEYYGWSELRLHPLLMKSIYRLKFKEPTPIQKACILAAAHKGKDVIGAAETGSGKTLAFGLPIFQRLLEEREKAENQITEKPEKVAPTSALRALIITPTRELAAQVTDHLRKISKGTNIRVVMIAGGQYKEKQERLLKFRPEVVVGTPGRLHELMSDGEIHLVEQHSLSFFVLDEADCLLEKRHFSELRSIIDRLPVSSGSVKSSEDAQNCATVSSFQRKKRQNLVFSATIALSSDFRKKLKRGSLKSKPSDKLFSIETLSERAGMRAEAAIFDLTNSSIVPKRLEESFIECREEDKDGYLYYILSVHGQGRTIVFCTSIAAVLRVSSLLRILGIKVLTLHAQTKQHARFKALDRFRGNENSILVSTDLVARGLDILGVRTVIHYQLPHSAEVYVHRSGRTARASADGCSIALISSKDASKFAALRKSFTKESYKEFPVDISYMSEVAKRLSLARRIDLILRKDSQVKANKSWYERSAESVDLIIENDESEEERVNSHKRREARSANHKKLKQELALLLSRPLQPKSLSHRYFAGAGISPLLQRQFEELAKQKQAGLTKNSSDQNKGKKMVVFGHNFMEPLEALRNSKHEIYVDTKGAAEKRRNMNELRRIHKEDKKCLHDQKRKQKKRLKGLASKFLS